MNHSYSFSWYQSMKRPSLMCKEEACDFAAVSHIKPALTLGGIKAHTPVASSPPHRPTHIAR